MDAKCLRIVQLITKMKYEGNYLSGQDNPRGYKTNLPDSTTTGLLPDEFGKLPEFLRSKL